MNIEDIARKTVIGLAVPNLKKGPGSSSNLILRRKKFQWLIMIQGIVEGCNRELQP